MVSLFEVVTDIEGIRPAVYVFSVVIDSYIEGCFRFSDILLPAFKAVYCILLQFSLCLMLRLLFVVLLEDVIVCLSCLQHCQSLFKMHGSHSPRSCLELTASLFENLSFPMKSWRFLHRRYARTGPSLNFSFIFVSI